MFGLNAGITGTPGLSGLKSKADALKYAIEFTATGEYPNRVPDMAKAKELFDFICANVQLPDVETDQLSNSLSGFTSLMEKLSKKNEETQDKEMEKPSGDIRKTAEDTGISLANPERIFCDFQKRLAESDFEARGEFYSDGGYKHIYVDVGGPVRYRVTLEKEVTDSAREAVDTVEGIVEDEGPVDLRRSPLRSIYNDFVCKCVDNGLIHFRGSATPGGMVESYTRKNGREYLRVILEHGIEPKPEKE